MKYFKTYIFITNTFLILFTIIYFLTINNYSSLAYMSMPSLIDELAIMDRSYSVKIRMGKDTILAFFDTGTSKTIFLLSDINTRTGKNTSIFNVYGKRIPVKTLNFGLDTLYIGNTKLIKKGKYYGEKPTNIYDQSTLGVDIFRHFIWKLDHVHQKIYFTQDSNAFGDKHLFSLPFSIDKSSRGYIKGTINGKEYDLLLDTGYPGFIHIKDASVKNTIKWNSWSTVNYLQAYYFVKDQKNNKKEFQITDMTFDKMVFKNEIIDYNEINYNLIGQDFLKRFEYVIIDYLHGIIHFGPIHYKSYFYLKKLRENINSIGIETNLFNFPQIMGVSEKMEKAGICLGDTIVKIDGLAVKDNPDLLDFPKSSATTIPSTSLAYLQYIKDEAVITIKKNGKEQDFHLKREHYVNEPDTVNSYEGPFLQPYPIYKAFEPILVDSTTQERKPGWKYKGGIYMRYINNKK